MKNQYIEFVLNINALLHDAFGKVSLNITDDNICSISVASPDHPDVKCLLNNDILVGMFEHRSEIKDVTEILEYVNKNINPTHSSDTNRFILSNASSVVFMRVRDILVKFMKEHSQELQDEYFSGTITKDSVTIEGSDNISREVYHKLKQSLLGCLAYSYITKITFYRYLSTDSDQLIIEVPVKHVVDMIDTLGDTE